MSRGGGVKKEEALPESVQGWVAAAAIKRELDTYKTFANQLLDLVRIDWILSVAPKEVNEEHLVYLANLIKEKINVCSRCKAYVCKC